MKQKKLKKSAKYMSLYDTVTHPMVAGPAVGLGLGLLLERLLRGDDGSFNALIPVLTTTIGTLYGWHGSQAANNARNNELQQLLTYLQQQQNQVPYGLAYGPVYGPAHAYPMPIIIEQPSQQQESVKQDTEQEDPLLQLLLQGMKQKTQEQYYTPTGYVSYSGSPETITDVEQLDDLSNVTTGSGINPWLRLGASGTLGGLIGAVTEYKRAKSKIPPELLDPKRYTQLRNRMQNRVLLNNRIKAIIDRARSAAAQEYKNLAAQGRPAKSQDELFAEKLREELRANRRAAIMDVRADRKRYGRSPAAHKNLAAATREEILLRRALMRELGRLDRAGRNDPKALAENVNNRLLSREQNVANRLARIARIQSRAQGGAQRGAVLGGAGGTALGILAGLLLNKLFE